MRIEYLTTIDEMATTQLLWLKDSGVFEKWIAWGIFYWVASIAAVLYFADGSIILKFLGGTIIGGILSYRIIFDHKTLIRNKLKKVLIKKIGNDKPIPATLLITVDEIVYSTGDEANAFKLASLISLEAIEDGLLLTFKSQAIVYIPLSAFKSAEEEHLWMKHIKAIANENA